MFFPAEKHQGITGRWRNIVLGFIFLSVGFFLTNVFAQTMSLYPRLISSNGVLFSIAIFMCYFLLIDFIFYWYHRAQHSFPVFWAIHILHHSDSELNVTSSMRTFWLEKPLQFLVISFPVEYILGIDGLALTLLMFFSTFGLFFTHSNLKIRLGPLTPILTGPQLHRIHHSQEDQHQNKNFSQFFPIFDIIFGTYYKPAHNEFPKTGTLEMRSEIPVKEAVVEPFNMWWKLFQKK
jgi:sterol desaturase/sphingolipid hydroxylase (fatty acid hydroxylase superfamily)